MKKITTVFLLLFIISSNAQIGGGWDWAFNTGSLGGANIKHMKYNADGSEILFGGDAYAAVYFGSTTYTAARYGNSGPGNIQFLGKINAATGVPTILKSYSNLGLFFTCITTDDAGNFYVGGTAYVPDNIDLGNNVTVSGLNTIIIAKFDATGKALWAKSYSLGNTDARGVAISKLAVSSAGNIFFWAINLTPDANSKQNYPIYKLDNSGNIIWFKNALNDAYTLQTIPKGNSTDKFIDDNENVHLFAVCRTGFEFDGVKYTGAADQYGASTLISLNASGTLTKAQTFSGLIGDYQVDRASGKIIMVLDQYDLNAAPFNNLPHPISSLSANYTYVFSGMVETDKDFNFIKAKDIFTKVDNPFGINSNKLQFLALPNGKLLYDTAIGSGSAGVDYVYPRRADDKTASAIIETDTNWNISKFITGGVATSAAPKYIAAKDDTYVMSAQFYADDNSSLPKTSYGTVNLTGFNAASDFETYSNFNVYRSDVAIVQTKSSNFPKIGSTTWLGNSTSWNDASNWSNGVPTNEIKAVFAQPTTLYPTVFTSPTAAALEIASGVSLSLPSTFVLSGAIKNEGIIILKDVGYFSGFNAKEWKGNGTVKITGNPAIFLFGSTFENSLILDANFSTNYDLKIPSLTFNSGKLNLGGKKVSITDPSPTAISGTSATSYIYGGTLERAVNSTGVYEFPVGTSTNFQSATVAANNLVGVNKISTIFNSGAITGTTPAISYGGTTIDTALNGGSFTVTPNSQPTSGTYDMTVMIKGSTNSIVDPEKYTVIKRDNSTSAWSVQGNGTLATSNTGTITAKNTGLTSFSDFAVGIGTQKITLGTNDFVKDNLKLYPNPTNSILYIHVANIIENGTLKIVSLLGQTLLEQKNINGLDFNINVSNLKSGVYVVQISDRKSNSNSKFVKL